MCVCVCVNGLIWLVSLLNGISTFMSYLIPKPSMLKNSSIYIIYICVCVCVCVCVNGLIWLVSWLNGISTFMGYLIPKPPMLKDSSGTI